MAKRRISPKTSDTPKKYTGHDVLIEAYRRMDKEFAKMGFPLNHPARAKLQNIVKGGIGADNSALAELGRIITTAVLSGDDKGKAKNEEE